MTHAILVAHIRLEKVCAETKQRMAEMIQQHDQDKQDAVDR